MTLPTSDHFDSASGTTLEAHNASWTVEAGSFSCESYSVRCNYNSATISVARWNGDAPNDHQISRCNVIYFNTDGSHSQGPATRVQSGNAQGYLALANGSNVQGIRVNNDTGTSVGSWAYTPSSGDLLALVSSGSNHEIFVNSTSTGTFSDATYSNGYLGIASQQDGINLALTQWEGLNLESGKKIEFRSSENATSSSPSVTVNRPFAVTDGDLLIAILGEDTDNISGTANADGFTCVGSVDHPNDSTCGSIWWKKASSEPATYTFSGTAGDVAVSVSAFYNGSLTNWVEHFVGSDVCSQTVHGMPPIDTVADALLFASWHNDSTMTISTAPDSMSLIHHVSGTSQELATYYQNIETALEESKSLTWSGVDVGITFGIAFTVFGNTVSEGDFTYVHSDSIDREGNYVAHPVQVSYDGYIKSVVANIQDTGEAHTVRGVVWTTSGTVVDQSDDRTDVSSTIGPVTFTGFSGAKINSGDTYYVGLAANLATGGLQVYGEDTSGSTDGYAVSGPTLLPPTGIDSLSSFSGLSFRHDIGLNYDLSTTFGRTLSSNTSVYNQDTTKQLLSNYFAQNNLSVNDAIVRVLQEAGAVYQRILSDNADASDDIVRDIQTATTIVTRVLLSSIEVTDGDLDRLLVANYLANNNVDINDFVSRLIESLNQYSRTLRSDVDTSDSVSRNLIANYILQDNAEVNDFISSIIESVGLYDRTLSSSVDVVDAVARTIELSNIIARIISDSLSTNDLTLETRFNELILREAITTTDAIISTLSGITINERILSSGLSVTDIVGVAAKLFRINADSVELNDSITSFIGIVQSRILASNLTTVDSLTIEQSLLRVAQSAVAIGDILTRDALLRVVLGDNVALIADALATTDVLQLNRILTDALDVSDEIAATLVRMVLNRIIFEMVETQIDVGIELLGIQTGVEQI